MSRISMVDPKSGIFCLGLESIVISSCSFFRRGSRNNRFAAASDKEQSKMESRIKAKERKKKKVSCCRFYIPTVGNSAFYSQLGP